MSRTVMSPGNPAIDAILGYWLGIEYLQPASAPKADHDALVWQVSQDDDLPWISDAKKTALAKRARERPGRDMVWRFTLHAGLADLTALTAEIGTILDAAEERTQEEARSDQAVSLTLGVDENGCWTDELTMSSMPWAMARLQAAGSRLSFDGFDGPTGFGVTGPARVREAFKEHLTHTTEAPELWRKRPLTVGDIAFVIDKALDIAGWRPQAGLMSGCRITATRVSRNRTPSERADDILNTFIAPDLNLVRESLAAGRGGSLLAGYVLGTDEDRIDVVADASSEMLAGTMPQAFPPGCWPAAYPLVLAQQYAVDMVRRRIAPKGGIYSVNGPPGTGKSTMLRDIVADIIVERAAILADFPTPDAAFGSRIDIRDSKFPAWRLDHRLRASGIVVASSNNGAVENITRELPAAKSIDGPILPPDYFPAAAETMLAAEGATRRDAGSCWGFIAAALGNATNRQRFVQRFWFIRRAAGDVAAPDAMVSFWQSLQDADVPAWADAVDAYRQARQAAEAALARRQAAAEALADFAATRHAAATLRAAQLRGSAECGDTIAALRAVLVQRDSLLASLADADERDQQAAAIERLTVLATPVSSSGTPEPATGLIEHDIADAVTERDAALRRLEAHRQRRPGWPMRLVGDADRAWHALLDALNGQLHTAERNLNALKRRSAEIDAARNEAIAAEARQVQAAAALQDLVGRALTRWGVLPVPDPAATAALHQHAADAEREVRQAEGRHQAALALLGTASAELDAAEAAVARSLDALLAQGIDEATAIASSPALSDDDALQKTAPWHDADMAATRARLFVAALELQKAFLINARKRVQANLGHFVDLLAGKLGPAQVPDGVGYLWDTFFLAVPVVSTTFASLGTLFRGVGADEIGWLLIDEAGQATPQAAVGGIWRARRAVIVGDPLQIEPVVTLPMGVVDALRRRFDVGSNWHPVLDSVQVLGDRAHPHGSYIDSRWVGSPLRVHRRCLEPMFGVANRIAYGGLMVPALPPGPGPESWLGPSTWIDAANSGATGHWIEAQGRLALAMLAAIAARHGGLWDAEGRSHCYVISPFRVVVARMKELVGQKFGKNAMRVVGTVHTFQGKEADSVILLLCGDPTKPGSISGFAARTPNLLNVAVTRARKRLYVVGNHQQWSCHDYFRDLAAHLPVAAGEEFLGQIT